MPLRQNIIFDEQTNAYLYEFFSSISKEQKASLNAKELAYIRTGSNIKRFVTNAILDKKLSVFTRLGMDWALVFFNPKQFSIAQIQKAYRQYSVEDLPVENIDQMLREKTFVVTNKEVAIGLSMMASNCHSDGYRINSNFLKIREDLKARANIAKNAEKNQNVQFLNTFHAQKRLVRLMMAVFTIDNYVETVLGLQMTDIAILSVLYEKPNSFYRENVIQKKLSHVYKPVTIATRCRKLFMWDYLEKIPTATKKPAFQIKAKGVLALGEVMNRIVNATDVEL
jgi:hypothetical protein